MSSNEKKTKKASKSSASRETIALPKAGSKSAAASGGKSSAHKDANSGAKSSARTNAKSAGKAGRNAKSAEKNKKAKRESKAPGSDERRFAVSDSVIAVIMIAVGALLIVFVQTDVTGKLGAVIGDFLKGLFGSGAYFIAYILIAYAILILIKFTPPFAGIRFLWMTLLLLGIDLLNATRFVKDMHYNILAVQMVFSEGKALKGGGVFGMYAGHGLYSLIGMAGLYIVAIAIVIVSLILLLNTPLSRFLEKRREHRELAEQMEFDDFARGKSAGYDARADEIDQAVPASAETEKQLEMDTSPESDPFAELKAEDARREFMRKIGFSGSIKPGKKAKKKKVKWGKNIPKNQRNILDLVNDSDSLFEKRKNIEGFGLDGDEPDSIRQPEKPNIIGFVDHSADEDGEPFGFGGRNRSPHFSAGHRNMQNDDFTGFIKEERDKKSVDFDWSQPVSGYSAGIPASDDVAMEDTQPIYLKPTSPGQSIPAIGGASVATQKSSTESANSDVTTSPQSRRRYKLPPIDLLKQPKGLGKAAASKEELRAKAARLEATLKSFNVEAKVVNVISGPAVTRYEIQPAIGVKVQSITRLSDDIALNMRANSIRIEAPIPGKAAVGIEIENESRQPVALREIITSQAFRRSASKLSFSVGRDIGGNAVVADLGKMPHLLIAGATGSGKSVCINTIIASILYKAKPEEVKLILIDPKMVELGNYNGIPHLLVPVVTDANKATAALNWAVAEMTDRYKKFAKSGVRDIGGYNSLMKEQNQKDEILPQIVIIIDELSDLMMVASSQVEDSICRLAQLARAAGMHLVVATQRPSVDVITGLIKANITSRIAFMVSSQIDSRTIIDMPGAEKLVGNGDMLFKPQDFNKPKRIQGPFISEEETGALIDYVKSQSGAVDYDREVMERIEKSKEFQGEGEDDDLLSDAVHTVINAGQASVSMLQRRFRIGYNRAARMVDMMESRGIVGPADGSRPRQVLITEAEFNDMKERGDI